MEIIFRGKCKYTNEWIYGDLLQNDDGYFISVESEASNNYGDGTDLYSTNFHKVTYCTIGQYINREDVNFIGIFMGDIVKIKDLRDNVEHIGVVKYANSSFYIDVGYMNCYRWMDYEVEVIGNDIDSQELLREI